MVWPMLELRWVLLGLGLLVFAGVYVWTVISPRFRVSDQWAARAKLESGDTGLNDSTAEEPEASDFPPVSGGGNLHQPRTPPNDSPEKTDPPRIVTLRFIPRKGDRFEGQETVLALREAGLRHGPFGIFHYFADKNAPEAEFSVANLIEPGTFDLASLVDATLPGMTFFMILPGAGDPVRRFDRMIDSARSLAQSLDARILDEQGSSWSIQRERFVREELIEYRHRMSRNDNEQ